jgi:ferrochelatase
MKWIGPSTVEAIEAAAADGVGVVISPIAFVSEHVETLVELDHEYALLANQKGCAPYIRVPALGVDRVFIDALVGITLKALDRAPGVDSSAGGRWCAKSLSQCPVEARA